MRVAQVAIVAAALWFAGERIGDQWQSFQQTVGQLRPNAGRLLASIAAVLALYAVQIHGWRVLVGAWGARLPFWSAARVWSVSNLARFMPASPLFTTGTMAVLAGRAGASPVAAAGSAVLGTLLSVGTGFVVLALTGAGVLRDIAPALPRQLAPVLAIVGGAGLVALPLLIRPLALLAGRVLRRPIDVPPLAPSALAVAVTANLVAWFLYGVSLRWLSLAFFADSGSDLVAYVAVFTAAYLAGWLFLPAPAGIGIREAALMAGLPAAGLATPVQAGVVVVASRLVLTVLEALPGAAFLARDAAIRSRTSR
jgi:hypothetical protein